MPIFCPPHLSDVATILNAKSVNLQIGTDDVTGANRTVTAGLRHRPTRPVHVCRGPMLSKLTKLWYITEKCACKNPPMPRRNLEK